MSISRPKIPDSPDGIAIPGDGAASGIDRLTPLEPTSSLASRAYEHIKAAIIVGDLAPGMLYSVNQFAEALGVSRTPVREALLLLARQGLLEFERNRGFRLRAITDQELSDIIELRMLLEVPSMGALATLSPQPAGLLEDAGAICRDIAAAAEVRDLLEFMRLDRSFHLTLTAALGNKRLVTLIGDLRDSMYLPGLRKLADAGELRSSANDHEVLIEAIAAGDAVAAERCMRRHLERSWHEWQRVPDSPS